LSLDNNHINSCAAVSERNPVVGVSTYLDWKELLKLAQSCVNWNDGIIDEDSFIIHGMKEFNLTRIV
jgi:hypothetical protein